MLVPNGVGVVMRTTHGLFRDIGHSRTHCKLNDPTEGLEGEPGPRARRGLSRGEESIRAQDTNQLSNTEQYPENGREGRELDRPLNLHISKNIRLSIWL